MLFTAPSPTSTTLASYLTYHALVVPQHCPAIGSDRCGHSVTGGAAAEVSFPAAEVSFLCGLRRKDEAKALLAFLTREQNSRKH